MVPSGVRDVIPPPEPLKTARGCLIPPPNKTCAICREKQINPCASSSGYVFCYLCLVRFVRDSPTCPISGISCTESDILRLYEDNYEVHWYNCLLTNYDNKKFLCEDVNFSEIVFGRQMKYIEMNVMQVVQLYVICSVLEVERGIHSSALCSGLRTVIPKCIWKGIYDPLSGSLCIQ